MDHQAIMQEMLNTMRERELHPEYIARALKVYLKENELAGTITITEDDQVEFTLDGPSA